MAPTKHVTLRIPSAQLAEIDRRAKSKSMTRTEFMIASALGQFRTTHAGRPVGPGSLHRDEVTPNFKKQK